MKHLASCVDDQGKVECVCDNACPSCSQPASAHTDAEWLGCMADYLATPYDPSEDEHICCGHQRHVFGVDGERCCAPGHAAWLMQEGVR